MKCLKLTALVSIASLALSATVLAQGSQESGAVAASATMPAPKAAMLGMHLEDNMDVTPVKGAPFCAAVTTEHTQSFADGNRIHTAETSNVCRDGEGRTRREASLNLLGAGPEASAPKLITILDPVAGVHYMLDSENKVAHKMTPPPPGSAPDRGLPKGGEVISLCRARAAPQDRRYEQYVVQKSRAGLQRTRARHRKSWRSDDQWHPRHRHTHNHHHSQRKDGKRQADCRYL